jgi:thiol-disulfide isomerase/thioredoxin
MMKMNSIDDTSRSTAMITPPESNPRNRRSLLVAAAGLAALAGAGLAWRRYSPQPVVPAGLDTLWQQVFKTPAGGDLQMSSLQGKSLALNFWATWCPPCVEELPMLSQFYTAHQSQGWQVLGLAVDQVGAVNNFLAKTPVSFPVAIAGLSGVELSKTLGNAAGALPYTVVVAADGRVLQRKMGRLSPEDLKSWLG